MDEPPERPDFTVLKIDTRAAHGKGPGRRLTQFTRLRYSHAAIYDMSLFRFRGR